MRNKDAIARYKIAFWQIKSQLLETKSLFLFSGWYRKNQMILQDDLQSRLIYCTYITFFVTNSHYVGGAGSILYVDCVPLVTCYCECESHFLLLFLRELLRWVRSGTSEHTVRFYGFSAEGSLVVFHQKPALASSSLSSSSLLYDHQRNLSASQSVTKQVEISPSKRPQK